MKFYCKTVTCPFLHISFLDFLVHFVHFLARTPTSESQKFTKMTPFCRHMTINNIMLGNSLYIVGLFTYDFLGL